SIDGAKGTRARRRSQATAPPRGRREGGKGGGSAAGAADRGPSAGPRARQPLRRGAGRSLPEAGLPPYDRVIRDGEELRRRPYTAAGTIQILRQHARGRMTVWERIDALQDRGAQATVLWQNWGKGLDGASIVTLVTTIGGRDVAVYGHDFT